MTLAVGAGFFTRSVATPEITTGGSDFIHGDFQDNVASQKLGILIMLHLAQAFAGTKSSLDPLKKWVNLK